MRLYAWQPNGHGEYSLFVVAASEAEARAAVDAALARRRALPASHPEYISDYDMGGWGTDYYTLTVAEPGTVLTHDNS